MAIRARSGPAPDANALRRNRPSDQAGWTHLPNHGLLGDLPTWPIEVEPPDMQEEALWNRMWRDYPQAHVWLRQHIEVQVAIYCRTAVFAASKAAKAPILTAFRQQTDLLLLSPLALRSARHVIDESGEPAPDPDKADGTLALVTPIGGGTLSVRDRMSGAQPAVAPDLEDEDENEGFDQDGDDEE